MQPASPPHVGKYRAQWEFLRQEDLDRFNLSFVEIEELLRFPLPNFSRKHLVHWHSYEGSAVVRAIHEAGFRAQDVNFELEMVVLRRTS
jgi:hypothetical protein